MGECLGEVIVGIVRVVMVRMDGCYEGVSAFVVQDEELIGGVGLGFVLGEDDIS